MLSTHTLRQLGYAEGYLALGMKAQAAGGSLADRHGAGPLDSLREGESSYPHGGILRCLTNPTG